ncbi:ATP-binding cassette domain-containing protein [Aeromicrobium camelliae]|uniref:ATP-binding cassette domain-containing protein n=1 Tax=Aeromicrobium camelliae TaxID=1538144 RepID=A0A3N6WD94_9ACTN|nr:ATP-binding cassette domain-containing protein [Aeromicrobium camelliae]RQN02972.1 ATP-binding cassette domain-containing protein [Aeromicrobium camelliae]
MTAPAAVTIDRLSKHFGPVRAVDDLSFTVRPGAVTGFLGPNGAGKTTTLRMLLGLVRPTSGRALIGDTPYLELRQPAQTVGASLEASAFHPGRSGLDHLRMFAPQVGVPESRCHELLELVGLDQAKKRRVGGYSMGMRQRLALAYAMLGDPAVVILDEPANGLDPQGIVWLRQLLRAFADEGKTVLVSSHVLSEVQSTVDDVVIIAKGRLVHESSLGDLRRLAAPSVEVLSPTPQRVVELAQAQQWRAEPQHDGLVVLHNADAAQVGAAAFAAGIELHRLADVGVGLEDVFLRLTGEPTQEVAV